jgi:hypothetical protein
MRAGLKMTLVNAARLAMAIGTLCALSFAIAAQTNPEGKRVLMLFNTESHQPAAMIVEDAIRSTLQSGSPAPLEIYSEYLDATRTPLPAYENDLVEQLRRKYAGKKFDLVFCINAPTLKLALQNRARLFPDAPIVFMVLDHSNLDGIDLGSNVTKRAVEIFTQHVMPQLKVNG